MGLLTILKKVKQKATQKPFVSEYQNLNSGSLQAQTDDKHRQTTNCETLARLRQDSTVRGPAHEGAELVVHLEGKLQLSVAAVHLRIHLRREEADQQVEHVDAEPVCDDVPAVRRIHCVCTHLRARHCAEKESAHQPLMR